MDDRQSVDHFVRHRSTKSNKFQERVSTEHVYPLDLMQQFKYQTSNQCFFRSDRKQHTSHQYWNDWHSTVAMCITSISPLSLSFYLWSFSSTILHRECHYLALSLSCARTACLRFYFNYAYATAKKKKELMMVYDAHSNIDQIPWNFQKNIFDTYCLRTELNFGNTNIVDVLLDPNTADAKQKKQEILRWK